MASKDVQVPFTTRHRQRTFPQACGSRDLCTECVGSRAGRACSTTPAEDLSTRLREQGVLLRLCGQPHWPSLQHDAGRRPSDKTAGCGNREFCADCVGSGAGRPCSTTPAEDLSTRLPEQGVLRRLSGQPCFEKIALYGSAVKLLRCRNCKNPDFNTKKSTNCRT